MGLKILDLRAEDSPGHVTSGIRFGNIRKIEPLSMRAKGILLPRQQGIQVQPEASVGAKLEKLRVLERSMGSTGKLAITPLLGTTAEAVRQLGE